MTRPTLVLVHGAYHSPKHFESLQASLESHGYTCIAVSLPSMRSTDFPPATLADDTAAIRSAVVSELDSGNDVVVVAHSYGGYPTNNALKDLNSASRTAAGASTSVLALAFICAVPLPAGTVLAKLMPPEHSIHDRYDDHFCRVKQDPGPDHYFYSDLSADEAKQWSDLLRPMSCLAMEGETTYAAYGDIPSRYLLCTRDNCMPFFAQQGMVQAAVAAGAKLETEQVDAGHSPFLSKVAETTAFIRRTAGEQVTI